MASDQNVPARGGSALKAECRSHLSCVDSFRRGTQKNRPKAAFLKERQNQDGVYHRPHHNQPECQPGLP
jgi:hypothetical protein